MKPLDTVACILLFTAIILLPIYAVSVFLTWSFALKCGVFWRVATLFAFITGCSVALDRPEAL